MLIFELTFINLSIIKFFVSGHSNFFVLSMHDFDFQTHRFGELTNPPTNRSILLEISNFGEYKLQ